MIKGINHQIIEISDTENIYYEKAWLVVRPVYADTDKELLNKEAKRLTKRVGAPSSVCRSHRLLTSLLSASLGAILGIAATLLIEHLM